MASLASRPSLPLRLGTAVLAVAATLVTGLAAASPASAASGGRVPGTPVAPLPQVNQSANGGTNPLIGPVPLTRRLGTPDRGVVPVVGRATAKADDGAYVAYEHRVDARTVDLMVSSPALAGAAPVRLRLPSSWSPTSTRTYPVLYLLAGGSDQADYQAWSVYTRGYAVTDSSQVMVVSPSVGSVGIATNWIGAASGYQYDTFLSTELPQLLRRGYRTNGTQAIAGISTGGYSAYALAALHPGRYTAAASFSGILHTSSVAPLMSLLVAREGLDVNDMWGDRVLDAAVWTGRDPYEQAARLRGTRLYASSGNGQPGPLDPPGAQADLLDPLTLTASTEIAHRLNSLYIPVKTDFYGNGTHSWPYWERELGRAWPQLRTALGLSS